MKFNLKQLTLASGVFGILLFLGFWGWIQFFPIAELHRQLLLEMLPGVAWPLNFSGWFWGVVSGFIWGALSGFLFGLIFNLFAPQE